MVKKLRISVIIPTYNRKDCVLDAVESVLSQDASKIDFEVIVSDDGSTDGTKELFKVVRKNVHYYFNSKNRGVNAARNIAIKKATGDYILLLDSDDVFPANAAAIIGRSHKQFGAINFFGTANVRSGKKLYSVKKEGKITYQQWLGKQQLRGEFTPIIKRSVFKSHSFDEDRFCFEGFFWNRVIKQYGLTVFDKVIRLYSFEQENRLSRKILQPEHAAKRYNDYVRYVKEFGPDYKKLGLERALGDVLSSLSVYAMLSGHGKDARANNAEAIRLNPSMDKYVIAFAFSLGEAAFRTWYSVALPFVRT